MPPYASFSFLDGSQEPASTRVPLVGGTDYTGANLLRTTMEALSGVLMRSWDMGINYVLDSGLGVGSRELKILVRCHDSALGTKWSFSIPGFATGINLITGTDFLDLDDTEAAAFIAAAQAVVCTPWYSNTIVIDSMERTRGYK